MASLCIRFILSPPQHIFWYGLTLTSQDKNYSVTKSDWLTIHENEAPGQHFLALIPPREVAKFN